jgi:hypothetical protein
VCFFSIVIIILGAEVPNDDDQGNIYAGLPEFVKILIHNFRLAVGDLIAPNIGIWKTNFITVPAVDEYSESRQEMGDNNSQAALVMVWSMWIINIFLMLIIMLNFLIAEVGQIYDNVKSSGKLFLKRSRC